MPVLALNLHAGFACRHSGACCTAGWPIPVETGDADAIRLPASCRHFPGVALLESDATRVTAPAQAFQGAIGLEAAG